MDQSLFSNAALVDDLLSVLLALAAGLGVFALTYGLTAPPRGVPRKAGHVKLEGPSIRRIASWLDEQQMGVSADVYIRRSLMLGIPLGLALFLLVGSVLLGFAAVAAGFVIVGTQLEQARDKRQVQYTKQLASACDTIRTAYGVNPSLKRALEAVAQYGQSPVREDFHEILLAASQERFVEGLQAVGERRRSIVFDTVATALVRASEASGEVNDMLVRLAVSTRQNVDAYDEAVASQINARSSIQWGSFGPWIIFGVFRLLTIMMSLSTTTSTFAMNSGFFGTLGGNILAMIAFSITLYTYRYSMRVAQRGLVVRRYAVVEMRVQAGQRPLPAQAPLNTQSRPAANS